jgi:uncharacterized protein
LSFDTALLDILCCPVTHAPLAMLAHNELDLLNQRIGEGRIRRRDDTIVDEALEQALVTRDGKLAYPVRDGIAVLLEDQGILMSQLSDP